MLKKPLFEGVYQIGLVVNDCMASIKRYNDDYGIGPWSIYEMNPDTIQNMVIRDKPEPYAMRAAITFIGSVMIELIEPLDDKSIYSEFLKQHGEGIHHILFDVEDHDKTVQIFKDRGIGILQAGSNKGLKFTYFDTTKELGLISEIRGGVLSGDLPKPDDIYPRPA